MKGALWTLLAAHVVTGWGTQWDIQWHLTIGRDSFWIAPHVMTYSGVTAIVLVSFGVLAWTTLRARRGEARPEWVRIFGITGPPGYLVAAGGIALTVLAAPIDDLWHRLFGLDVTLWSPPHLLGLFGGIANAAACALIAMETHPRASRARLAAIIFAGVLVYGGLGVGVQPAVRIGYTYGGVAFFLYPMLAALFLPLALVTAARLTHARLAPLAVVVVMVVLSTMGTFIARVGFAWLQPQSFLSEEIAKDPTSPIAVTHEIARKNGMAPGGHMARIILLAPLAAAVMSLVDPRRRPVTAGAAYGVTMFVAVGFTLARLPAFAQSLPTAIETTVALAATVIAGLAGGALAARMVRGDDVLVPVAVPLKIGGS
jgi:hypothetical protein